MSDDLQAAIIRLWKRSRPIVLERIGTLEEKTSGLAAGRREPGEIEQARVDAHKLVGSLGTFGLPLGSELAREVEEELQCGGRDPARLAALLAQLRAVVEAS